MTEPGISDEPVRAVDLSTPTDFFVTVILGEGTAHITATGDLDIASCDRLTNAGLSALRQYAIHDLILDMASISFIDAAGIGSLVSLSNAARERGTKLTLRDLHARVLKPLRLTGLYEHFTLTGP